MSCVDAAIIKALVEHVGMDPEDVELGGHQCVEYTAGDAIALEDNQIHVKFNSDMFEINDNELCLKSGSGGGATINGVSITLDDLIPITSYYEYSKVATDMTNDAGDLYYTVKFSSDVWEDRFYKPELGWVLRRPINGGFQTLVCTHINTKPTGSGIVEEYEFTAHGGTTTYILKYTTDNQILIPDRALSTTPDNVTTGFFRLRKEATGANTLRGLLSNLIPAFQKLSDRIAALEKA